MATSSARPGSAGLRGRAFGYQGLRLACVQTLDDDVVGDDISAFCASRHVIAKGLASAPASAPAPMI